MTVPAEFVAQFARVQRPLYSYILTIVWDAAEADDVLQETNLALWQKAAEFDPGRDFLPWALQFAKYTSLAWLKRRRRDPLPFDDAVLEKLVAAAIASAPGADERLAALGDCLRKLPEPQRMLIAKRYEAGGPSVNDLAASRGTTPKAVSQLLYRIRMALLDCVEKRLAEEAYS